MKTLEENCVSSPGDRKPRLRIVSVYTDILWVYIIDIFAVKVIQGWEYALWFFVRIAFFVKKERIALDVKRREQIALVALYLKSDKNERGSCCYAMG